MVGVGGCKPGCSQEKQQELETKGQGPKEQEGEEGNAVGAGSPWEMGEPPGGRKESRRAYPACGDGKGAPSLPLPCELCAPPQDWMGV